MFVIGERLRALREAKGMPQSEIERRTGLLRCYISRVENGHTIPSIETLEKLSRALDVRLYQLFYDIDDPSTIPEPAGRKTADEIAGESSSEQARFLNRMATLLERLSETDRRLLLHVARRMADV
ncbi:MAG TPA: helix-turn-helix transcriptional regulator [Patescibacteria group bacterium]|nr:helix-turn-helix transcriptional regulator [Patescibacteria group bacterium]